MSRAQGALVRVEHEGSERGPAAVVLPGRGYGCDEPLLRSARAVLRAAGWSVRVVRWNPPPAPEEVVALGRDLLTGDGSCGLVVAKSLSTRLLPLAGELALPGVWLTPLLREPDVRAAAAAATAPALLVGGTADPFWDGEAAAASGQRVLEVPGADHSLEVAGDPAATARALAAVVDAVAGVVREVAGA